MSEWIDVTRPVDETLMLWPNRLRPAHTWEKTIAGGHHCNVSSWQINAHTGTHMDAPLHFIDGGTPIDQVAPDVFMGECVVIDIEASGVLTEDVAREYLGVARLLVRTAHSGLVPANTYPPHKALMTEDAAKLLNEHGMVLIGTDRLSVDDSRGEGFAIHRICLGAGCVIVEGLNLSGVALGRYELAAAPLRLTGTEASPCRALLRLP